MSENLNKLKAILREMFQLDQADLDFGIYRIMNQKREEIEQFLDRDLLPCPVTRCLLSGVPVPPTRSRIT